MPQAIWWSWDQTITNHWILSTVPVTYFKNESDYPHISLILRTYAQVKPNQINPNHRPFYYDLQWQPKQLCI